MNVQKVYVAVYVTIDLADGYTVYKPIADVSFDSEVSDKDFICQQAVNRIITDYPWTVTVDFTWYAEVA